MKFTSEQIAAARQNTAGALEAAGFLNRKGEVFCPRCTNRGTKQQINSRNGVFGENGFITHWKCGFQLRSAIDALCGSKYDEETLLVDEAWKFADAVSYLLGIGTEAHPEPPQFELRAQLKKEFSATFDQEVYEAVLQAGDVGAALEFYGQFGIDPDVVRESRAVVITDMPKLRDAIMPFGPDRLVACGLAMEPHEETGIAGVLITGDYSVVEPQLDETGLVRSMQFRAANHMSERIIAHKVWKQASEEAKAAGTKLRMAKAPFVSKFLSLRGASTSDRPGFGFEALAEAVNLGETKNADGSPRVVVICEGLKDALAIRTGGRLAYALPGAGQPLPLAVAQKIMEGGFAVSVEFDGDEAGGLGGAALHELLTEHGFNSNLNTLPEGKDHADHLLDSLASA